MNPYQHTHEVNLIIEEHKRIGIRRAETITHDDKKNHKIRNKHLSNIL